MNWFNRKRLLLAQYMLETQATLDTVAAWSGKLRPGEYRVDGTVAHLRRQTEQDFVVRHRLGPGYVGNRRSPFVHRGVRRLVGTSRITLVEDEQPPGGGSTGSDKVDTFTFKGTILVRRARKSLLLDLEDGLVLHTYQDENRFQAHAFRPEALKQSFPAPDIVSVDPENRTLVEQLTNGEWWHDWSDKTRLAAKAFLLATVKRYFSTARENEPSLLHGESNAKTLLDHMDAIPELHEYSAHVEGWSGLRDHENIPFALIHGHGDLRLANMVATKNGFLVLDWEFSRVQPFFYDVLHWLFMEVYHHHDPRPLRLYLSGGMDKEMQEVFSALGREYDPGLRAYYLGVYVIDRALQRTLHLDAGGRALWADIHLRFFKTPHAKKAFEPLRRKKQPP